jgi:hypothetical protein
MGVKIFAPGSAFDISMHKPLAIFLSIYMFFTGLVPVHAQDMSRLSLFDLDLSSFPTVSAGLDVFDSSGNFITGLTPAAITLLEDAQPRPLTSLEELQPGAEFALALDPGPYFAYRDAKAVTRFDKVVNAVKEWASTYNDSLGDDLSLVPTGGTSATHLATMTAFTNALAAYQPNLFEAVSSTETLSRALDVVSEPTSQAGRKPVVLYITSIPAAGDIPALQNLAQRAVAGHIRVAIWVVACKDCFSTSGATALEDLAIQTGGQVVQFTGDEPLPSPEEYLAPLRHVYRLEYTSGIITSGDHTMNAQVNLDGRVTASEPLTFKLDVQPPNPILVDPPDQVVRSAPDEQTTAAFAFLPTQQTIDIIIEFPDGRTRPLARTALYVDGVLADENTAKPFDQFTWSLSGYAVSGKHILTVEATDILGLSKVSIGIPVLVTVIQPPVGLLPWLSRNSLWVALGATLFAGVVLGVILVRGQVRRRRSASSRRDPLTQSVQADDKKRTFRAPWTRSAKPPEAYLVRLKDDGQAVTAAPIPLMIPEIIFGSDPLKATRILDDPSVSPVHARLKRERGEFILSDEKSAAGTWVNYEQLTTPRRLQHGDVLHIGRLSYRFMLRKPPDRPAPRVTPIKK